MMDISPCVCPELYISHISSLSPSLISPWCDTWQTSRIATSVAAIILSENLGFDVELVEAGTPKQVYNDLSKGSLHLAFESWPESNSEEFVRFTDPAIPVPDRVDAFLYNNLFGQSGIYETCSRSPSETELRFV